MVASGNSSIGTKDGGMNLRSSFIIAGLNSFFASAQKACCPICPVARWHIFSKKEAYLEGVAVRESCWGC
jgi:hypothetical protein